MELSSLIFLYIFLPLNLILYYLFRNNVYRNLVLILFSLIFYAWGEVSWAVLLVAVTFINYFFGLGVEKGRGKGSGKAVLVIAVIFNLALFAFFKYGSLWWGPVHLNLFSASQTTRIGLPLGLSFYLFRVVAYLIDIYREEHKAERNFIGFLTFMSLFHLVIGPIVRYSQIPGQIRQRTFDVVAIRNGLFRFCIGLFKKVFIANVAGEFVVQYMATTPESLSMGLSWFGLVMFAVQIYFDFSGYSDMAIGLGGMFGFRYIENFNYPYVSRSIADFWRRWHISLSTFLRDYIYSPLAVGMRNWGKGGVVIATMITFIACGLWHGATWNFILWGAYFGILISLEILFLNKLIFTASKAAARRQSGFIRFLKALFGHVYFLAAILLGWTLFYFTDLDQLWKYLNVMFGNTVHPTLPLEFTLLLKENAFWLAFAIIFCMPLFPVTRNFFARRPAFSNRPFVITIKTLLIIALNIALIAVSTSMLVGNSFNAFIYGNF